MGYALEQLRPFLVAKSVSKIDFKALAQIGIRRILIDLNGTLAPTLSMDLDQAAKKHLIRSRNADYFDNICVFSNTGVPRLAKRAYAIAKELGAACHACYWPHPTKPDTKAFEEALRLVNGKPKNTVMIGDQLRRDILGANMIGMRSILVKTLDPIPFWKRQTHEKDRQLMQQLGIEF